MRLSPYTPEPPAIETQPKLTGNPARDLAASFNVRVILFLMLHLPLALASEFSPWFSTGYALVALLYGLRAALLGRMAQVLYATAYIAAAEVLWRMSRAYLLWEYAKYAMILIVFLALLVEWRRHDGTPRLRSVSPLWLMVMLAPAAVLTVLQVGLGGARDPLSFNLSGHLTTVILALFLWARPVNRSVTINTLLAVMAPVAGITFLAVYYTVSRMDNLDFVAASNWITSGSYGPNQVSNMMGLGALAGSMLFILMPRARGARLTVLLLTLVMLGQGLLTFSRGGIYSFVLAIAVFGFHLMATRRARGRFLFLMALFTALLIFGVYPMLDDFTGGTLSQRFSELDTTGRLEAAELDMQAFNENPVVGLGVGQVDAYHEQYLGYALSAHTEFTRLMAEHGLFGILALLVLIWMMLKRYLGNKPGLGRAMTAALMVWALSIMVHSAMRLAAIPFAFALGLVLWQLSLPDQTAMPPASPPSRTATGG